MFLDLISQTFVAKNVFKSGLHFHMKRFWKGFLWKTFWIAFLKYFWNVLHRKLHLRDVSTSKQQICQRSFYNSFEFHPLAFELTHNHLFHEFDL